MIRNAITLEYIYNVFPLISAPAINKFWDCEVGCLFEGGAN